jgi:DNA-binding NarL/FixJ family response regulator
MNRILLIEDHLALGEALAVILELEPNVTVVGHVGTIAEARGMLDEADLAVVDLRLPDGDGIDLIPELVGRTPRVSVLVLTASLEREMFGSAIEAGADGVLSKSASLQEITDAVGRLCAGEPIHSTGEILELIGLSSRRRENENTARLAAARLTPRERQILEALAGGSGSREIAERLGISRETEHAHMVRIFSKLGVHSRVGALAFALRHDLVELPPASDER